MNGAPSSTNRRASAPKYDPLEMRSKKLADLLWERAMKLADAIAPEHPADSDPIDDFDAWKVLRTLSFGMRPEYWEADAIDDFHRLLGIFEPRTPRDHLPALAAAKRQGERALPDITITPENPDYEKMMRRIGRS